MKIEDLKDWLDGEIADAIEIGAKLEAHGEATSYHDWEDEVDRLNQQGFVMALEFVRRQL